jgi:hypothetical protein
MITLQDFLNGFPIDVGVLTAVAVAAACDEVTLKATRMPAGRGVQSTRR